MERKQKWKKLRKAYLHRKQKWREEKSAFASNKNAKPQRKRANLYMPSHRICRFLSRSQRSLYTDSLINDWLSFYFYFLQAQVFMWLCARACVRVRMYIPHFPTDLWSVYEFIYYSLNSSSEYWSVLNKNTEMKEKKSPTEESEKENRNCCFLRTTNNKNQC